MPASNQKEIIDTRILKLIGLEDVFDLDYETYLTLLKEAMVKGRMAKTSIPTEEIELLTNEYKRVKTKKDKGRFEVKEKKITANSFAVGSIKAKLGITRPKGILPTAIGKSPIASSLTDSIAAITSAVTSIAETLKEQKTLTDDATAFDKRKTEQDKRALAESKLEKRFDGLKKTAEKIIAPVKSLLDKVLEFFTTILLGRVVYKLIEWFGDPKNADKVKTIGRFLGDHWPKLLALYLTFGTSFGRFALGLTKAVAKGAVKLAFAIAKLLAAKKVKGAMGAARFLGRGKGKLLAGVLGTGAALGGAYAVTQGLKGGEEEPKTQKYSGGGLAVPRFSGGGLNLKGMMGGASMGAMFGPLGMLLGGALGSGKPQEMASGFVKGPGGPKDDKVPAMLSDGEFVMSTGAVRKYGVDTLESMNAAGGGTNKPKVVDGTTYAAGGGLVGDVPLSGTYGTNPSDDALRRAARTFNRFGSEEDLFKTFKKLNGVPDFGKMVGENNLSRIFQGQSGGDDALDAIRRSVSDKLKAVNNPQSFTQSSRAAAGLDDLAKKFDIDAKTAPRYAENLPKLNKPNPRITRIDPSRMLPSAGQSSANAMRAAAKAAQNVRPPIPASSSIVPYAGSGLARTGVTGGLSVPQIRTNMNVPGGRIRGGRGGLLGTILTTLAEIFAPQLGDATGSLYNKMGIGIGNLSDAQLKKKIEEELKLEQSLSGSTKFAAGQNERLNLFQRESERRGLSGLKGGKIMGGYGLKEQSFKDAPKTQIMTDDNGKPFIGHKALRSGKIVYVRGPQPGQGTTNPLEMLGRFINPGAYKQNDAKIAMKDQKIAMVNALESMQKQGMAPDAQARMMKQMGGNLKDTQNDLTFRKNQAQIARTKPKNTRGVKPPTSAKPRVVYGPPVPQKRNVRGGGTSSTKTPSFNATTKGMRSKQETLGLMR